MKEKQQEIEENQQELIDLGKIKETTKNVEEKYKNLTIF